MLKGRGIRQAAATPQPRPQPPPPLTSRSDMGVLSPSGRCCSSASTMQLAMIVARIMYSNGVRGLRTGQEAPGRRGGEEAHGAQCSRRGEATSGGAEDDRSEAYPALPTLTLGGRLEAEPLAIWAASPSARPGGRQHRGQRPRPALHGSRDPRGGDCAPRARLEEGPRAGAHSHLETRSHMYLHRHLNIHVPRVPNARTRNTGFM